MGFESENNPMAVMHEGENVIKQYLDSTDGKNLMVPASLAENPLLWVGMANDLDDRASFGGEEYATAASIARSVGEQLKNVQGSGEKVDIAARLGDIQKAMRGEGQERLAA